MQPEKGIFIMTENTRIFLDFLIDNGFNPENYRNILEIIQSVPNSVSKYLKNYPQFLLSEKVDYSELISHQLKGANGYIDKNGRIIVPKTEEGDKYFKDLAKNELNKIVLSEELSRITRNKNYQENVEFIQQAFEKRIERFNELETEIAENTKEMIISENQEQDLSVFQKKLKKQ